MSSEHASSDPSTRSVDLRIAIGERYGFDFRKRVRDSSSNSRSAIYFVRDMLEPIAEDLGVGHEGLKQVGDRREYIRRTVGEGPRGGRDFDEIELWAIIDDRDIDTAGAPFSIEEPETPEHLRALFEMLHADETLVYSSDYPHWDNDNPAAMLAEIDGDTRRRIFGENAREIYGL
jgi:hypothetical protein